LEDSAFSRAGTWRIVIAVAVALAILSLGVFNAFAPQRNGDLGFYAVGNTVAEVSADGARAGLRLGDHIDFAAMPWTDRLATVLTRSGSVVRIPVERSGRVFIIPLRATVAVEAPLGRSLDLLIELGCVVLACVVLVRARRGELAAAVSGYTLWSAAVAATADVAVSGTSSMAAFIFSGVLQNVAAVLAFY
jgi:hypothetical protein